MLSNGFIRKRDKTGDGRTGKILCPDGFLVEKLDNWIGYILVTGIAVGFGCDLLAPDADGAGPCGRAAGLVRSRTVPVKRRDRVIYQSLLLLLRMLFFEAFHA